MSAVPRIALTPRLSGVGGMVSFQHKLEAGLARRGIQATYDLEAPADALLVTGGTHHLGALSRARRRGVRLVQRLDGMNWLHRLRRGSLRYWLRAEYGNRVLSLIRSRFAHSIVYQSEFSRDWWERVYGPTPVPSRVVYNGVDLQAYHPEGPHSRPTDRWRLLLVEGSLRGGYEAGLESAVRLAQELAACLGQHPGLDRPGGVELVVAGRVEQGLQQRWEREAAGQPRLRLAWAGLVPAQGIPELDRSAHLLFSGDLNPACPNSVIEALACGLPVLAFDTGALGELAPETAGRVVPYGGNPWKLEPPDIAGLARAALEILAGQEELRRGARRQAEARFDLERMVDGYLEALLG